MAELKIDFTKMAEHFERMAKERGLTVGWWTPVSEMWPEEKGYYITTTMHYEVYCDYWDGECFDRTEEIIAWMPLPKHYEPKESEDEG